MNDWDCFVAEVSWFRHAEAIVGEPGGWDRPAVVGLPVLSALLVTATVTPVSVSGKFYELLAWGPSEDRRGWLCELPPQQDETPAVCDTHRALWGVFGGIVESFSRTDRPAWWLDHGGVLTVDAARQDIAGPLHAYRWMWEDHALTVPIDPADYYVVGVEANGNLMLIHRERGELVLFAPDHDFDGVTPLPGCPPYSLLTIDDVPDLVTWIEQCAAVWSAN